MKKIILLFTLTFISLSSKAQSFVSRTPTFIGKTQEEIVALNKLNNNEFFKSEGDSIITTLIYNDSELPITHHFIFAKDKICFSLIFVIENKSTWENVKNEILNKCEERLTDNSCLQKDNGNDYVWRYRSSQTNYTILCQKK